MRDLYWRIQLCDINQYPLQHGGSLRLAGYPVYAAESLAVTKAEYREIEQIYSVVGVVEEVRQSTVSAQISGHAK